MGLTAVARKLAGAYSGGMKRRLDLACALVHRPEVLTLDEPTEGLDPQSRTALWEELERISRQGTTMLTLNELPHPRAERPFGQVPYVSAR